MKILALDTATRATAVALWPQGGAPVELRDDPPRGERPRHTTLLMPMLAELLERTGLDWEDIDRIAVGVGPGTFTGLRVGVATARALAQARSVPVVGISTLESLATGAVGRAEAVTDAALAVLDARRGEVFAAAWRLVDLEKVLADPGPGDGRDAPRSVLAPSALSPEALAHVASTLGATVVAVGEGAVEFRQVLERSGVLVPEDDSALHRVTAVNHCRLALQARSRAFADVRPAYLRRPDAEIALGSKGAR